MPGVLWTLRRMLRDDAGGIALMLALSLIPLSIAALGALDLQRAISTRSQLQDALDGAALAALRASANDATVLQDTGAAALADNLRDAKLTIVEGPTFKYGPQRMVLADAGARVKTMIAGLLVGGGDLTVRAHSEIKRSDVKLEIAMVLDNTGSMAADGKIQALRTAAKSFVDTLETAAIERADPDAIRISLVPFSQTVRVDPSNAGAPWLDTRGKAQSTRDLFSRTRVDRFALFNLLNTPWAGCVESRPYPYDVLDTAASDDKTRFAPFFWPDEDDSTKTFNNYLPDVSTSTDWKVRQQYFGKYPTTKRATGFGTNLGPNRECNMLPIRPLTNDFNLLRSDIAKMGTHQNTNIPMGLVWGWHTISPNGPFANAPAAPVAPYGDPKHSKIAVLMTDGYNQYGAWGNSPNITKQEGVGYVWQGRLSNADGTPLTGGTDGDRTQAMNRRLAELCVNMKAKKIEIFTVAVQGLQRYDTTTVRECATAADHFYEVDNTGIGEAFAAIARQISRLYLSR
jgi:Flp pilus assembly protein TadG